MFNPDESEGETPAGGAPESAHLHMVQPGYRGSSAAPVEPQRTSAGKTTWMNIDEHRCVCVCLCVCVGVWVCGCVSGRRAAAVGESVYVFELSMCQSVLECVSVRVCVCVCGMWVLE